MESKHCIHLLAREDARSVTVLMLSMVLFLLSGPVLVKGQSGVYLFGDNVTLQCVSTTLSEDEHFLWKDVTDSVVIYSVTGLNDSAKTPIAMSNEKYDNFGIDNNYPNDVNLLINLLDVEDGGTYSCSFIGQDSPAALTIDVEAMPISVSISCARSSLTDCSSPSSPTSDAFRCNCIAFGAFPKDLEFEWSVNATDVMTSQLNNTERAGSFDIYTNAEIVLTENPGSVTCTLTGYSENWEGDRNAVYNFNPPMCDLNSSCSKSGTMVSLTCTCTDAAPAEGLVYSFFNDGELLSSGDTNVFEADIDADQEYIFGCRGCNGLNYGNASNATQTVMCQRSATAFPTTTITNVPLSTNEPTSTKAMGTTTVEPESKSTDNPESGALGTGAIVGISFGSLAVVIVILVIAMIMCKKGEGGSKSESDKPDNNGAGPGVDPEIPAYGVIDKNRTNDPTPVPLSSMRDSTNSSKPKQPNGIQYAVIDHSNKPPSDEVIKPKEESTE